MTTDDDTALEVNDATTATDEGTRFFGDDPTDGATSPDLLDRLPYAQQVVELLDRVKKQSRSSVLALIGPWGSGKSSVLLMTLKLLRGGETSPIAWRIAEFNPWNYPDLDSLQAGFFAELRSALPSEDKWSQSRQKIGDIGKAISPLGKLTSLVGVDASSLLEKASSLIAGDTSLSHTHREAERALAKLGQPILMVLDDLDRLAPDELLRTLKLVRLVGRLPNVYYMLCYDERTLLDVLQRTQLVGFGEEARARDYMDKIVQVRLDVPPLRSTQAAQLFDMAFDAFLDHYDVTLADRDTPRLARIYWDCLHKWLNTPRSINRFVAQLDAFYGAVRGEVDIVDYTVVTWIRTARPRVYSLLQGYRAELTMTDMNRIFRRSNPDDANEVWRGRLQAEAGVDARDLEDMLFLLDSLFAAVHSVGGRVTAGDTNVSDIGKRCGVGHIDYFDRYFAFGIPADDLPDGDVVNALQLLAEGGWGDPVERLIVGLVKDTLRTVRKLENAVNPEDAPAVELLTVLADAYGHIPNSQGALFADPRRAVEFYAERLIRVTTGARGPALLQRMARSDAGLYLAAWTVARTSRPAQEEDPETQALAWQPVATQTIIELIKARLDESSMDVLPEAADKVFDLVWPWYHLDQNGLAVWLSAQVESGRWTLLDVLAGFVPTGGVSSSEGTFAALGDVSLDPIETVFGLDQVLSSLASEIAATTPPAVHRYELEPTWENRKLLMLRALKAERDRRAKE